MIKNRLFVYFLSLSFLLTSCASVGPAPSSGFIDSNQLYNVSHLPFHKAWVHPEVDLLAYSEIYIAPVNTDFILKSFEEDNPNFEYELDALAYFMHEKVIEAFSVNPENNLRVVKFPSADSLALEIALVEIVPNKKFLEAASYTGVLFGPITSAIGSTARGFSISKVAFEARVRDGFSGEVVAAFADREGQKRTILPNLKSFVWYGNIKAIIEEWAEQFVFVLNSDPYEIIPDSPIFELRTW